MDECPPTPLASFHSVAFLADFAATMDTTSQNTAVATTSTGDALSFATWFSEKAPTIALRSADAVLTLAKEGATIPFIARYRKEQTGNLDEVEIQTVIEAKELWDSLEKRKEFVLGEIERVGKLTPELRVQVAAARTMEKVEDLYLPYKQKRKTKAVIAKEAGLEPLAEWVWEAARSSAALSETLESKADAFIDAGKGIESREKAIEGARDILIERVSEDAGLREKARRLVLEQGYVRSKRGEKATDTSKFDKYFEFEETIASLSRAEASHRYLALRRGWMEEELVVSIGGRADDESLEKELLAMFERAACPMPHREVTTVLHRVARLALKAHVLPSIDTEVHRTLRESAEKVAIQVFADNVRTLLLASPYGAKAILAIDPGIRTGNKCVVIAESGAYVGSHVLFLHSDRERTDAAAYIAKTIKAHTLSAIAIGNGTAGRETETWVKEILRGLGSSLPVVLVSEAGASVYSASQVARDEFPDLDLTVRGAISIGRRFQDPLAELVKVDPKSIGVGQYQHDVSPVQLQKSLAVTVELCVNKVGVDVNTASSHLLEHVSGIGPSLARAIVAHREQHGNFSSKKDLLKVSRFSDKVFEQAAGFLRVPSGENPLDNTGIHPEQYARLDALAKRLGKSIAELTGPGAKWVANDNAFKAEVGEFTFRDLTGELEKPGRDPRDPFVIFTFREDLRELSDVKPGMTCPGIVTNVTNFGAFVDIGVHQDGLVHISQLADRFVKDPHEVVSPGTHVSVRVIEVNLAKKQMALTMRSGELPSGADRGQTSGKPGFNRPQASSGQRPSQGFQKSPQTRGDGRSPASFGNDSLRALEAFRLAAKGSAQESKVHSKTP
ncbi:MAG: RNA-binding transcriptional accessory protein [Polyangiaceae bacterium]|nr:RNA-binding transcriptional accessory protein [Polyangiaceae bacterium]